MFAAGMNGFIVRSTLLVYCSLCGSSSSSRHDYFTHTRRSSPVVGTELRYVYGAVPQVQVQVQVRVQPWGGKRREELLVLLLGNTLVLVWCVDVALDFIRLRSSLGNMLNRELISILYSKGTDPHVQARLPPPLRYIHTIN